MKYKVWDKKSDINGVSANNVLANINTKDDIVLFYENENQILRVEEKQLLKSIYNIEDEEASIVAEKYLSALEEEKKKLLKEQVTLEKLNKHIKKQDEIIDHLLTESLK